MKEERTWGNFSVLHEEDHFKVKIIEVFPGKRLSYQSHDHRMERWVVVDGEAEITLDGDIIRKGPGEMMEIGMNRKHRLANTTETLLKIIEVQLGDYLGEDDIKRYEDDFGRA